MPGSVHPSTNEPDELLAYLAQQRYVVRVASYGLTDAQARATPTAGSLSIGGIVKHLAQTEQGWIDRVQQGPDSGSAEEYMAAFTLGPDETLARAFEAYDEVARRTEAVIRSISDLNQPVPVPKGVPWFPDDLDAWTVRWILLHLIEETARHAGHADIVRESLDGATAFPLMAAVEGWPASPWIKPWEPASIP